MLAPTKERLAELDALLSTDPNKRVVTVFDIDGTVCHKQLLIELMCLLVERFPSRKKHIVPMLEAFNVYETTRSYDYGPVLEAAVKAIPDVFADLPYSRICALSEVLVEGLIGQTYLFTRTLLNCLAKQSISERGLIVAITGAPQAIAGIFGERLGFDLVCGVEFTVRDKLCTGECNERTVHEKGAVLQELANRLRLNLSGSAALGDSFSDVPMLTHVEHRFAFNPNDQLLAFVRQCGGGFTVVFDRQKSPVTVHRVSANGGLIESTFAEALPPYVQGFSDLPGAFIPR